MIDQDLAQCLRLVEGAVTIIREQREAIFSDDITGNRGARDEALGAAMHRLNGYLSTGIENTAFKVADWCAAHPLSPSP